MSLGEFPISFGDDPGYVERIRDSLLRHLPPGIGFARSAESNMFDLCERLAIELARVRSSADDLLEDMVPFTTISMLDEWEEILGLPTSCFTPTTVAERQAAIVARLVGTGNHSLSDYRALAESLGYDGESVVPEYHYPFTAGSEAGDALTNDAWAHVVTWNITSGSLDTLLECAFNAKRRAHATFLFDFNLPLTVDGFTLTIDGEALVL